MSDDFKKIVKNCFEEGDTSGDGTLSIQEIKRVISVLDSTMSDSEIATFFADHDKNQDSRLTFEEFWTALSKRDPKTVKEDELRAVFRDFDADKTGFITSSDLRKVFAGRTKLTDEDFERMIGEADKNSDDKLNFEEFLNMWKAIS